ncbi:4-hydroxythreonine-4-phosphate dehydrogenase PdxA [bacterium]|nr:4-hydroxythreonine-4-phosphate dehydrogenase PdxA [bacterium]
MNKIAITTGDRLGIGKEVLIGALNFLQIPQDKVVIIGDDTGLPYPHVTINESDNGTFCYKSLIAAAQLARNGDVSAIVTAPISKEAINSSGYKFSGQTEILEEFLSDGDEKAEMLFIAEDLRVMLLTRHIALKDVPSEVTIEDTIEKTKRLHKFLVEYEGIKSPKIAFCAFNPHIGDNGLFGDEDDKILIPAIQKMQSEGLAVELPQSADALFGKIGKKYLNSEPQEYDAIISIYHDQALCAVKAIAFDEVVNTTIGLKVIRTSPSHGSAYDIAGKGIADCSSMIEAIKLALRLKRGVHV